MAFNWDLRVPYLYSNRYITLRDLHAIMLRDYHPEYVRRFIGWLHYKNGNVGAGGLSRSEQPNLPGFAPSLLTTFHWAGQTYNDGRSGACAVDTVYRDGPDPGDAHDGIPWREVPIQGSPEAARWGIHANVGVPGDGESWHLQAVEIDGHASWVAAGRPAPVAGYPLPAEHDPAGAPTAPGPQPPPTPIQGVPDVFYPINPFRNSDTRAFGGAGVAPGVEHVFDLNSGVFPAATTAVALNVVALGAAAPGFVTVWPDGQPQPNSSFINFRGDGGAYNGAIVVGVLGRRLRLATSATCHVIIDVTGYWTA